MQVHGQHAVDAGLLDQPRHQPRGDRHARGAGAPVLARVAHVGHDRRDARRRGAAAGVRHHQQLHDVVVHRRAGGLHDVDVAAADVVEDLDVDLAVGEAADVDLAEREREMARHALGEPRVRIPREDRHVGEQVPAFGVHSDLCSGSRQARWLGWEDSNLRMAGSKPAALPLGYTPIASRDGPRNRRAYCHGTPPGLSNELRTSSGRSRDGRARVNSRSVIFAGIGRLATLA